MISMNLKIINTIVDVEKLCTVIVFKKIKMKNMILIIIQY